MNFTAIDFETANAKRTSACSLGIAVVKNKQIVEAKSWLIRPQPFRFDYFNILINGFNEEKLWNKPLFCDCWDEIKPYLEHQIIVTHNAAFDISVLARTLDYYKISFPDIKYICSYKASQKVFTNAVNYRLDTLARSLGISFRHHDALEDAVAVAKILMHMIDDSERDSIESFAKSIDLGLGRLSDQNEIPCSYIKNAPPLKRGKSKAKLSAKSFIATTDVFDQDNELYGKTVVITGRLHSMGRAQAYQIIADLGGQPADRVTKKTGYLILGIQDYRLLNGHKLSSKTRQAIKYAKEGTGIQIISEEDFYKMIGGNIDA